MLKVFKTFTFGQVSFVEYLCEDAGDELPLHSHTFNHLTLPTVGEIEIFTDGGNAIRAAVGDGPFEYSVGRKHGIRGLTAGARFLNISPLRPVSPS